MKKGGKDGVTQNGFSHLITNDDLKQKLKYNENIVVVDVRQREEYEEYHIPGSILIPLDELKTRYNELNKSDEIYVICELGGRSDLAMNFLLSRGFKKVANVLPGLCKWFD